MLDKLVPFLPLISNLITKANPSMPEDEKKRLLNIAANEIALAIEEVDKQNKTRRIIFYSASAGVVALAYVLKSFGIDLPVDPLVAALLQHLITLGQ